MTSFRHEWAVAQRATAPAHLHLHQKPSPSAQDLEGARLQPCQKQANSEGAFRAAAGRSEAEGATIELLFLREPLMAP